MTPSSVRMFLPTSLYPKDAPANHVPGAVHCDGNCLFQAASGSVYGHEDATQILGRKWPLSYTDMFLDVGWSKWWCCFWSLKRQIHSMLQLI